MSRGVKQLAGFPSSAGDATFYRVVGWRRENDKGNVVKCSEKDAEFVVVRKKGKKVEVDLEEDQLFFCPENLFLGKVSV